MATPKVRSAALSGFAPLARSLGLAPEQLARQAGLPLQALSSPDVRVRARTTYRLMELAAEQSGALDLGLRLAKPRGLSHLGVLGLLARDEHEVRAALRRIMAGMSLHSTCVSLDLSEAGTQAEVRLSLLPDGETQIRQSTEAGMGLLFQIMIQLLGAHWHPLRVRFMHSRGGSAAQYRGFFGCPVEFGQEFNAIVLARSDLDRPIPGADPGFQRYATNLARLALDGPGLSLEKIRWIMGSEMPSGHCTSESVSLKLGVHRRTLHRHLQASGTHFSDLLDTLRLEMAQELLQGGLLNVSQIALQVGFNSVSAFSRWFRSQQSLSPSQWRARIRNAPLPTGTGDRQML